MQKRNHKLGFSLIELLIVLAVLSSMLLLVSNHYQHQQQRNRVQEMVSDLAAIKNALYNAGLADIAAADIASLRAAELYSGAELSPWQQPYQIMVDGNHVRIRGYAGTLQWANAVARLLPYSEVQGSWVELIAVRNSTTIDAQWYLHRLAMVEAPELNQMAADLDMAGWRIVGASEVHSENVFSVNLTAEEIFSDWLQVNTELYAQRAELNQLTATHLQATNAVLQALSVEQLTTQLLTTEQLTSNSLSSEHLQVNGMLIAASIQAQQISAADFITPSTSLSALQAQYLQLQQLWLQCIQSGSCQ